MMESYTIDLATQHPNSIKIFDKFDTYRVAYKYIKDQPIHAFFIIPRQLPAGPRPLLVRFHGGGWTEGEADASIRPFFLELALKHGAVIVTPDYRLRPEHEMTDGIDDIRSFWKWVEEHMKDVVHQKFPKLEIDLNNLLVGGESAGGYHTAQTALLGMTKLPIKVLFLQYPALDLANGLRIPETLGQDGVEHPALFSEVCPLSLVEDYLATIDKDKLCTRAKFGTRMPLMKALVQANQFVDISGDNAWIDPMISLETAGKLPPMLLYQSKEDESIPWEQTEAWANKLKKLQPDVPLYLTYLTGDHVFDKNHNMSEPWLQEPLEFVQKYWPAHEGVV